MARVWMGDLTFADALRSGEIRLEGPRDLVRAFPMWLLLSERPPASSAPRPRAS